MSFSDMLFGCSHSVEQLVDIQKNKKVDKVLLKVVKTIRSRANYKGWVKPESNLKTDLKLSDKVIASIKKSLGDYYNIDLSKNNSLMTAKSIAAYIKSNKSNVTDSIYFIDAADLEEDTANEVNTSDAPDEVVPMPTEEPVTTPNEVVTPDTTEQPTTEPAPEQLPVVTGEQPTNELQPKEEEMDGATVSTEALAVNAQKGKMIWTEVAPGVQKQKFMKIDGQWGPMYPSKDALVKAYTRPGKHFVRNVAIAIPFNFVKKYLKKFKPSNEHADGGVYIVGKVDIPTAICVFDQLPTVKISKEGLDVNPQTIQSFADVMDSL